MHAVYINYTVWNGISRLVCYTIYYTVSTLDDYTLFPDSTFRSGADGSEFEANQMEGLYQSRKNDPPRTSLHFPIPEDDLEVLHYLTSSTRRPRSATGTGPRGYQFRERAFSVSLGRHHAESFEGQECSEPNLLEMVPPISQFPSARLCAGSTVHSATLPLGFQAPSYFESRERGVWPDGSRMMKFQKEQQSCPCSSCSDVANYQFPVKTVRSGSIGNANTSYYNARRMWAEDDETTSESFYRKFDSPKFDSFRPKKESTGAGCVYSNVHATAVFEKVDRDDPGHSSTVATLYDCPVSSSLKTDAAEAEKPPIENNIQTTIAADVASGGETGNDVIPIDTVIPVRELPIYKNVGKNCPCCGNVLKTSPAATGRKQPVQNRSILCARLRRGRSKYRGQTPSDSMSWFLNRLHRDPTSRCHRRGIEQRWYTATRHCIDADARNSNTGGSSEHDPASEVPFHDGSLVHQHRSNFVERWRHNWQYTWTRPSRSTKNKRTLVTPWWDQNSTRNKWLNIPTSISIQNRNNHPRIFHTSGCTQKYPAPSRALLPACPRSQRTLSTLPAN